MKIRHKLVILLAVLMVTLNGVIGFLIYKRTRQEFIKEFRGKAKLIAVELETTRNYLASALKTSKIEITEQTKYFIPAISGHAIGVKFAEKTGYIIKQTSLKFRNPANKPDPFEERILRRMEEDPELLEYWADDVINGKRVERYLYALYVKEDCLLCHGSKEAAPKFIQEKYDIGYDYKVGDLRGAISVIIPKEIAEQQYAANVIFFITVAIYFVVLSLLGVRYSIGLALAAGFARFVPYVGPAINWTMLALVTFFQPFKLFGMDPLYYTLLVFFIALFIDQVFDNIVSPRIMADALRVHPAAVLVAAIISASLLGVLGVVIAAPMLATLQLFGQYTLRKMLDLNPWPPQEARPPSSPRARPLVRLRAWWRSIRRKPR